MKRHLAVTAVAHAVPALTVAALGYPLLAAALYALAVAAFVPLTNAYLRGDRLPWWRAALVDGPYFVCWTAGLLAIPLALSALLFARPASALAAGYSIALVLAGYGALVGRRLLEVRRLDVRIDGLDASLDGYRIAHLSDLHIGAWTPRSWGLRWARAVNELGCDLVVVTGDLIQNGDAYLEDAADVVSALRARDGVVVALGNHDYYGDTERLVALLESHGVHVLRNASLRIKSLCVAAVDHRHDISEALKDRPERQPTILLAHDPVHFDAAAGRDVDLVLSGHTHGGQIALPFFARRANLARFAHRHTLGSYRARRGESRLIVHPGLGTSGPPVRIGVAPAILELTLRS